MLKSKGNWRILEAALAAVSQITQPMSDSVSEVLRIALDDNLYCEAQAMAFNALNKVVDHCRDNPDGHRTFSSWTVAKHLTALNAVP